MDKKKVSWKNDLVVNLVIMLYIIAFTIICYRYSMSIDAEIIYGEWDDYAVTTASLMNDGNFTISDEDIVYFKELFPSYANHFLAFSPYIAKDGNKMPWYAPTYSIYCIPFVILMKLISCDTAYSFRIANLVCLVLTMLWVMKNTKLKPLNKIVLVMLLTVHPVFLIIKWQSAETFIYCLMIVSVISWLNGKEKTAALFCALASTLNPVLLFWGVVMTLVYIYALIRHDVFLVDGGDIKN